MALTRQQKAIIRRGLAVGNRRGAGRKAKKAYIEALIVESGIRNLKGGDRDSAGPLQQRPSQGWGSYSQVRDIEHAAREFFKRAVPLEKKYKTSGQLAQAVQRSAFPERYDQQSGSAGKLLRRHDGGGATAPQRYGLTRTKVIKGGTKTDTEGALIDALLKGTGRPITTASRLVSTGAYTTTTKDKRIKVPAARGREEKPQGGSRGSGAVSLAKGADRPGAKTSPKVLSFVERISALSGERLTIGTGTQHSRLTVNGNVSDHWDGHAADIPASGKKLIRLGQAALIAAGMSPKKARKIRGGLFNVGGHQIIFATNEGGNHYDHLHVSAR